MKVAKSKQKGDCAGTKQFLKAVKFDRVKKIVPDMLVIPIG